MRQALFDTTGETTGIEPVKPKIRASHKKKAHEPSLAGRKQEAVAIIKAGRVVEFQFESTGDLNLDAAIHKDLTRVKDRVKLPTNIQDGQQRADITFEEKSFKRKLAPVRESSV